MLNPLAYRPQFDSLRGCCHMISNSLGAMPNRARDLAREYVDVWARRGVRAWDERWWNLPREVGNRIGALMNAPADSVAMHLNVTSASATVLSCFDLQGRRNKVVMVDMEFPSILYLYRAWLEGRGRLEIIPSEDGVTIPMDRLLSAIDESTLLVPISHVLFRSAYIMDVEAIIARAHAVGAMAVLDVFQSLGTVPVDVTGWNVDFAVGGCLKWLCGGPGACFLYVRPDLHPTLQPRLTGWMAHDDPFAFDHGPIAYTSGSYRFLNGTPNIPALYNCQPGLEIVDQIGIAAIRERSVHMTERLLTMARERGWPVTTPADSSRRGGTVAINVLRAQEVAAELHARNFLVDYRPDAGIRLSPHFYNTDEELGAVMGEIEAIMSSAAHTIRPRTQPTAP
ncbi:MAG: aminotransferase class V-fold PLP-dependent enzyme [candidate division Zixibacteria bacterium]|nr:aminotransferase class V-fold PLP-dependent enzyme [candidate division Zixibacteria bacterium]